MQHPTIIVTGASGVGKSAFSQLLAERLRGPLFNSGDVLREHLMRMQIPVENESETGTIFLERLGENAVGEVIAERAMEKGVRVIDGVRLYSSYITLVRRGVNPLIAHITTTQAVRIQRFVDRSLAEGSVESQAEGEQMLSRKDRWNTDLDRFHSSARWHFDNSGPWDGLVRFATEVAGRTC